MNIKTKAYRVLIRFLKAFTSGFFTGAVLVTFANVHQWSDLGGTFSAIGLSAVIGGLNGVWMALEKYSFWKEAGDVTPPTPDMPIEPVVID